MRVLITNHRIGGRAGVQSFVRDLARGLQAGGHSVMAYTSDRSQLERVIEQDLIPVVTDLTRLPLKPDIIHAQHHLDAMTALAALPGVPALYHAHGALWRDWAPVHPRIYRYLAVSRTLADRLIVESGLDPADVGVLLNPIDLTRFSRVRTPPERPMRALFYNSRTEATSPTVAAIRDATARAGLALDLVGYHFDRRFSAPEHNLLDYDVVFASGISAIEAAACGCAVIVLGRTSCGDLVDPDNFDRLRHSNFSIAVNSPPPSAELVEGQLRRYSAAKTAAVTARLRREAAMSDAVADLVGQYARVIERNESRPADLPAEMRAIAGYLRRMVPLIKATDEALGRRWGSATAFAHEERPGL